MIEGAKMKKILIGVIIIIFAFTITLPLFADDNKIDDKFDLAGTYQNPANVWEGTSADATWNYKINIKVAVDKTKSKGIVHFWTDGVDVVGHVEEVKREYAYWVTPYGLTPNLAAVGWANYNDHKYYFMLIYTDKAVQFVLSDTPYETYWNNNVLWDSSLRAYQTHSGILPAGSLEWDYKDIH